MFAERQLCAGSILDVGDTTETREATLLCSSFLECWSPEPLGPPPLLGHLSCIDLKKKGSGRGEREE